VGIGLSGNACAYRRCLCFRLVKLFQAGLAFYRVRLMLQGERNTWYWILSYDGIFCVKSGAPSKEEPLLLAQGSIGGNMLK
jgi:hypothetical protein